MELTICYTLWQPRHTYNSFNPVLISVLWGKYYCHPQHTEKETEAQKRSRNLFKITQLNRRTETKTGSLVPCQSVYYITAFGWANPLRFHLRVPAKCWGPVCMSCRPPPPLCLQIPHLCPYFILLASLKDKSYLPSPLTAALLSLKIQLWSSCLSSPLSPPGLLVVPSSGVSLFQSFLQKNTFVRSFTGSRQKNQEIQKGKKKKIQSPKVYPQK